MEELPYSRYMYSTGMERYTMPAHVNDRALNRSDTYPARMPPATPPTSNSVDSQEGHCKRTLEPISDMPA